MLFKRLKVLFLEFATLILFWAVYWPFGIKAAIGAVVVYVIADAIRRHVQRVPFTKLYLLTTALTICFGAVDIVSQTPFMLQYEAVITSVIVGIAFFIGALGERPLIQSAAEDWVGEKFPPRADIRRFFMLFTLLWAFYFFAKAAVYLWIGLHYPMAEALEIRTMIGVPSLIAMIVISTQGRYLFMVCRYLGIIPSLPLDGAAPQAATTEKPTPTA